MDTASIPDDWKAFTRFVREWYATDEFICLHEPQFHGNEQKYVADAIESTFVSSVGSYVDRFERDLAAYVGTKYAIACVNGTAALHAALTIIGVEAGDEVLTQSVSFVATTNAIHQCHARPVFVDVDATTCGISAAALRDYFEQHTTQTNGQCINKKTGKRITACVPVHIFGHPLDIHGVVEICAAHGVAVVEDAAETLGSFVGSQHCGTFGELGAISFNGNKIITTGGGGAIFTDDERLAKLAKHATTTAKVPHRWNYVHDMAGFNYRMPNLNAALGCAQLENIDRYLEEKRQLASEYAERFHGTTLDHFTEPAGTTSNYWLNAFRMQDAATRERFLEFTNDASIMTRPVWAPLHTLPMYQDCERGDLSVTEDVCNCLVNVPSGLRKRAAST